MVEVLSGLEAGQRVVSEGVASMRPGLTVQPQGETPVPRQGATFTASAGSVAGFRGE
jgi:hypothetical protein